MLSCLLITVECSFVQPPMDKDRVSHFTSTRQGADLDDLGRYKIRKRCVS